MAPACVACRRAGTMLAPHYGNDRKKEEAEKGEGREGGVIKRRRREKGLS